MKCPNCEKEIENGSVFCEYCGTRIKKSKKGLWITLGVVCALILTAIVVGVIQEQQREKAELEQAVLRAERRAELARQEVASKASTTTSTHQQTRTVPQGYVDLGLPSGVLWKDANEGGDYALYTNDEAVNRWGSKLPTKAQLEELKDKCTWTWTGNGYKVTGPNGNSITLSAAGNRYCGVGGDVYDVGADGFYWSSAPDDSDYAWFLYFNSSGVGMGNGHRCGGLSVRLVRNL